MTTPSGLWSTTWASSCLPTSSPSTSTTSLEPTNVFNSPRLPLTETRPALISSSAARRDAMPPRARKRLRRTRSLSLLSRAVRDYTDWTRRLADLIVGFGANVQPGQLVGVTSYLGKEELTREIARAAYERGARYVDVLYWDQWVKRQRLLHGDPDDVRLHPAVDERPAAELRGRACSPDLAEWAAGAARLRGRRRRPQRLRSAPLPAGDRPRRERKDDELVRGSWADAGLGCGRLPRRRSGGRLRPALDGNRACLSARRRRSGGRVARAHDNGQAGSGGADEKRLRRYSPARPGHRPHGGPVRVVGLARRRIHDRRRPRALPERAERGDVHDTRPAAGRGPRLGDLPARAVRLDRQRHPDRVPRRAGREDRRRPERGDASCCLCEGRRRPVPRRARTRRRRRPHRATRDGVLRHPARRERGEPHRARFGLRDRGRATRPRSRSSTRARSTSTS